MIVLFTDFGLAGPYTGQMLAVLQQDAPGVAAIPLFADAPAGQPKPSAYLLAAYAAWFPAGTVFLCVVDPGSAASAARLSPRPTANIFVGPDNGLFDIVLRRATDAALWEIAWRPPALSASFHGRDLFAPVAARLARGDQLAELARPADDRAAERGWPDDLAEIVYIDHYGNALTGLRGTRGAGRTRGLRLAGGASRRRRRSRRCRRARRSGTSTPTASPKSRSVAAARARFWGCGSAARWRSKTDRRRRVSPDIAEK